MFAIRARNGRGTALCCALCLFLSLTLIASASISIPELPKEKRPDKKKEIVPPPQPVAVAVEVPNGGTVQIPLRIYGRQEQTTNFLIRKGPELGKIVSLEPLEAEVWLLTYKHTAAMSGEARMQDRILFAAQNKNGTSAAAEIVLTIVDTPPELAAPGPVEFGEIAAGLPATRIITVSNKGGGLLEGNAMVDAPWTLEPAHFKLRQGEKALFQLTLVPDAEREYQGRLHFVVGDTQAQPDLHASAFAPFSVEPSQQALSPGPARSGTVTLTNQTATALTVQVEANPRLRLPSQIVLPPRKTETVAITLGEEDPEGIDTTVRFAVGSISKPVQIQAERAPKIAPPSPAPLPSPKPAPLASAAPTPLTPPASANVPPPRPSMGDVPGHNAPPTEPLDFEGFDAAIMNAMGQPKIPVIRGVSVVRATVEGTAELAWPALPGDPPDYRVEVRRLSMGPNGNPVQNWIAVPDVQFTKTPDRVKALLTGIPPGISVALHILALNPQGKPCAVSFPVYFNIPTPQPLFTVRRCLLAGFGLLLAASLGFKGLKSRETAQRG